jgi:hypothetical protein
MRYGERVRVKLLSLSATTGANTARCSTARRTVTSIGTEAYGLDASQRGGGLGKVCFTTSTSTK